MKAAQKGLLKEFTPLLSILSLNSWRIILQRLSPFSIKRIARVPMTAIFAFPFKKTHPCDEVVIVTGISKG